jgi:multidrug efflux pump subunit AcrA (membrane-fusion protein)
VQVAEKGETRVVISGGLLAGSRVVIAGVDRLTEGQQIKLTEGEAQ